MNYVPLAIPPGVFRNGTEYQSQGRWYDSSLVRWENGEMKPVGGWQQKGSSTVTGTARGVLSWRGRDVGAWAAIGTVGTSGSTKLYVVQADNTFADITPTGITDQDVNATAAGYGWLDYGDGTYGTARAEVAGAYNFAASWSLDTWGQYLVACLDGDGRIYEWQNDSSTVAAPLANAPGNCSGIVVTPQRFIFALGAEGDSRRVEWCDQEDNTDWTATALNQAGYYILESGGPIMQGVNTRGQTLIFTTTDVYAATYIGAPLVYSFERVGSSNGIVSRRAAAASDSFVAWMGPRGFWTYDGYVRQIPCEVEDYVFSDFNEDHQSKVFAWVNSQFNEIWWHYPSASSTECDRYVAWNYAENHWSIGQIPAYAACDRGVLRYPLMVHSDSKLYEHEVVGVSHGTLTPYATSGPLEVGGGKTVYATKMIPDEKSRGDVTVELLTRRFPNGTQLSYGPYSIEEPVSLRLNARQVSLKIREAKSGDWRWGTPRVMMAPGGMR